MKVRVRRDNGSIIALAFVALVPLILAIGGFGVDCMHFNDERGALQRATDAGALAGAIDIPAWKGTLSESGTTNSGTNYTKGTTGTNEEPVDMALAACGLNVVDGRRPVTNTNCRVFAEMLQQFKPTKVQADQSNPPIACHVHADMKVRSLFAGFFGNWQQSVTTDSVAGAGQPLTVLYKYLPVLMSAPQGDQNGSTLQAMWPNGGYGLNLNAAGATFPPGAAGTPPGNSVWMFNTDAANLAGVNAMMNNGPNNEPALTIDSTVTTQPPGFSSPAALAAFDSLQPGQIVIVPVTADYLTQNDPKTGAPPTTGPHKIIGFLGLQIQHTTGPGSWWVNIVPAIGSGAALGPQDPVYATYGYLPQDAVTGISLVQ